MRALLGNQSGNEVGVDADLCCGNLGHRDRVALRAMLVAREVEVRAGARLLLSPTSFQVAAGDKIGLVGRNGAGKTTLTRILAGESLPAAGAVTRTGQIGYLPQDPRTGDVTQLAKDRILSARGLDQILRRLHAHTMSM